MKLLIFLFHSGKRNELDITLNSFQSSEIFWNVTKGSRTFSSLIWRKVILNHIWWSKFINDVIEPRLECIYRKLKTPGLDCMWKSGSIRLDVNQCCNIVLLSGQCFITIRLFCLQSPLLDGKWNSKIISVVEDPKSFRFFFKT